MNKLQTMQTKNEIRNNESQQLLEKLTGNVEGELLFDAVSRGQYATDASIYQAIPHGVLQPKNLSDIVTAIEIARECGVPVLPRGAGTSQNGQTLNTALVLDNSRHFSELLELDVENRWCRVQPGMVLDTLNRLLKPHGLWYPVDVSTASRATIGGMTGNNSCGQRSIVYGTMRDNVTCVDAVLASGDHYRFSSNDNGDPNKRSLSKDSLGSAPTGLTDALLQIGARDAQEINTRFPKVLRRVGGYNIDALIEHENGSPVNFAHLLVGSEGTLAYSTAIELKLSPLPGQRVLGICHFPTFYDAMDAAQHLVKLGPSAVELIDDTMVSLARDIDVFRPVVEKFVRGDPKALLLVEFAEETHEDNLKKLKDLGECMGELGFDWRHPPTRFGGVVEAIDPGFQAAIGEVRKSGLNIMMSMKTEGKPVSFLEDCAVELPHLAEYTAGITEIFKKHGTTGTWYAHASVGCLHVRPILNMKLDTDIKTMRAIADEAFDLVLKYKGSHSGEHGDGISRSEFHEKMFGRRLVDTFSEVKDLFDPNNLFNPGRIVNAPKMNDRELLRFNPNYQISNREQRIEWSQWKEAANGFQGAVEMCNNNGACRKLKGGAMCPSFRVTREEKHVTRGRANALRLALSGQLGEEALESDELFESMKLCVSCKACKRECPTSVDMARMKIEVLAARHAAGKSQLRDRLVGHLPRYAHKLSRWPFVANLRNRLNRIAIVSSLIDRITGLSKSRQLPEFQSDFIGPGFLGSDNSLGSAPIATTMAAASNSISPEAGKEVGKPEVVLWIDTFNRYFEPSNIRSALRVLQAAGYVVVEARAGSEPRPLCCGRTYLASGMVDQAREELQRTVNALLPLVQRGARIVGLEPSCLLTLRDELQAVLPGNDSDAIAGASFMFEEFLHNELMEGRLDIPLKSLGKPLLVHGHCHQKAFDVMGPVQKILELIPGSSVNVIESSCCGMAGAFGYQSETVDISRAMAELDLLPAVREASDDTLLVADGTSCRHQIRDGSDREALHVARVLDMALETRA